MPDRFRQLTLTRYFNSPARQLAGEGWVEGAADASARLPRGRQRFWGIPFALGPADLKRKGLIVLEPGGKPVQIRLEGSATHVCVLHFCNDLPEYESNAAGGEHLADYRLIYADGSEHVQPIRRRFEINPFRGGWGSSAFAAQPAGMPRPSPDDSTSWSWGQEQTGVHHPGPHGVWVYALENPRPRKRLGALELRPVAAGPSAGSGLVLRSGATTQSSIAPPRSQGTPRAPVQDPEGPFRVPEGEPRGGPVAVLAVTLYSGPGHPLRHVPRRAYKLILPAAEKSKPSELKAELDMGVITRLYAAPAPVDERWLTSPEAGLGGPRPADEPRREFLLEATGAPGALLTVKAGGSRHDLALNDALAKGRATHAGARVELLQPSKTWVHVTVLDENGKPTPTRIHFRGKHGDYLPPYGHHADVNDRWFEDYGGDLKLGDTNFAYVPGAFQIDLPVGEVYVDISKGFEYTPVRRRLDIKPGQRELTLRIPRWANLRADGWVTADTHVHFITPQTAWLEGQGEGLNLINLLASQWGKLFTNVGDITGELSACSTDDTLVWVGTENRHHLLGHISMLGTRGEPVFPMCAGGPGEAYLGDPDFLALTEWAEMCRQREGVVIRPHFPSPICEEPVYICLGQLDGVEIRPSAAPAAGSLDQFNYTEWYRYLNCGYRVAAVGGTDKMSAGMPVGSARTYAQLDPDAPFTFANWGKAVRAGRTYTTSGPLMDLQVEGRGMGEEIRLPSGGGTLEVRAVAQSAWPVHLLEVVVNGRVVASASSREGAKKLSVVQRIRLPRSSWIAARCASNFARYTNWHERIGGHTSPVYVVVDNQEVFSPSDASYMLTLIDGGLTYLDTLSVRYDEKRHRQMKAVFQRAQAHLHARIHAHHDGHDH